MGKKIFEEIFKKGNILPLLAGYLLRGYEKPLYLTTEWPSEKPNRQDLVGASSVSFACVQAQKLIRCTAPPLPQKSPTFREPLYERAPDVLRCIGTAQRLPTSRSACWNFNTEKAASKKLF